MTKGKRSAVLGGIVMVAALAGGVLFASKHGLGSGAGTESSPKATATRRATPLDVAETVYDGKFGTGWEDWGWGPHDTTQPGPAKVVFEGYGGIILHHTELSTRFGALSFRYKAPAEWGNFLYAALKYRQSPETALPKVVVEPRHVAELADGWREVLIDWRDLNPTSLPVDRVLIGAAQKVSATWVLLDKIVLTKGTGESKPREQTATLRVACDKPSSPINPLIYGTSVGVWSSGTTAHRTGGNVTSRFNWDLNAWNTGSDWFFENIAGKGSFWENVQEGPRRGIQTALVVPTLGWVAKDTVSSGFPIAKFPRQRKTDSYRPSAGDGHYPDGSHIQPGPPTETSIPAPPELIGKWIKKLREQDAARGSRTVHMYILDNEPSLWNETHRDVHPDPVTYDELLDRTIRYASAIRKADPEAVIAGPAEWGWTGYFYSAKDRAVSTLLRPDRRLHDDMPLIPWYLQQLAEYEKKNGVRLLDVLNVHFYPAADGVYGNARTDLDSALLRLRSTRSLWDPTYEDESWIKDRVRLIPRLKEWVRTNYPGTKVAIGEWHFGAEEHMSGALAMAEALGRFGQQGLDAAFLWGGPKENTPAFWAFRAFRNFDGQGGRFLDWSVPTTTTAEKASFFASKDENGSRIVAIVLNLDPLAALRANIELTTCGTVRTRRMFSYKAGSDSLTDQTASLERDGTTVVDPFSFQVLELSVEVPTTR